MPPNAYELKKMREAQARAAAKVNGTYVPESESSAVVAWLRDIFKIEVKQPDSDNGSDKVTETPLY